MLVALLLISTVACEWVEIAQQHYKKPLLPVRPTHNYPSLSTAGKVEVERATKGNRIYINHSLLEYNWNKGSVFKDDHVNVNRIQFETSTEKIKPQAKPTEIVDFPIHGNKNNKVSKIDQAKKDTTKTSEEDTFNPIQHKFPNTGIRRVQLFDSEKLPTRMTPEDFRYRDKSIEVLNLSDLDTTTEEDLFTTVKLGESKKNNQRQPLSSTVTSIIKANPHRNKSENSPQITEIVAYSHKNNKPNHVKQTFTDDIETENTIQRVPSTSVVKRVHVNIEKDDDPDKINDITSLSPVKTSSKKPSLIRKEDIPSDYEKFKQRLPGSTIRTPTKLVTKPNEIETLNHGITKHPNIVNYGQVTEVGFNTNEDKGQSTGNINRGPDKQMQTSTTEKVPKIEKNRYHNLAPIKRLPDPEEAMVEEILKDEEQSEESSRRTLHIGTVKRVQLPKKKDNIPLSTIKPEKTIHKDHTNKFQEIPKLEDQNEEEQFIDKEILQTNIYRHTTENVRRIIEISTEEVPLLTTAKIKRKSNAISKRTKAEMENKYENQYSTKVLQEEKPTFVTEEEIFEHDNNLRQIVSSTEEVPRTTTLESKHTHITKPKSEIETRHKNYNPTEVRQKLKPTLVTKEEIFEPAEDFIVSNTSGYFQSFITKIDTEEPHTIKSPETVKQSETNRKPEHKTKNQEAHEETITTNTKADNIEKVVKLIKVVADTISRNTKRNLKSKMHYLEELRDNILINIEERIESAFPGDAAGQRRSRSAHAHASPRGHIEFPSSEGALMTISFLTFAVFLIKLVLQVIQTYKSKTMMVPAVVASVRKYRARY